MPTRFQPARGSSILGAVARGPTGLAATVEVGTVTELAPGATPTVANGGTDAAATLNFGLPGTPTIEIGTVTTVNPGDPATVTNSGTAAAIVLDFDIPQGDPGSDGVLAGSFGTTANVVPRASGTGGVTAKAGLFTNDDSGNVYPNTSDTGALGTTTNMWADLFLASGGVVNFSNGDVTITHAANDLRFAGATGGYRFDAAVVPNSSDGAALGATSVMWSDLFLASGAVINFNAGNYTITHTAGLLTLNGAVSLGTGNVFTTGTIELGHASANTLSASGGVLSVEGVAQLSTATGRAQGKETIFIPAAAMVARTTNGAAAGSVELTTNKIMVKSLDFDTSTQEFAQFSVWFPKSWNLGTVTFQPSFSQLTTAAGGVVFGLAGVAVSSTDDLDAALGTAQTSTTTAGTLNKEYQGPESSAITIAGTPAAGDRVIFQINRTVADASDTLAQDARLHGIRLFFTTNASTDT